MRLFQTILIIGGVLLFAGFGFIGYEVYKRATDPSHPRSFASDGAEATTKPAAAGPQALPAGSRIGQMLALGQRVVYHVILPDGSEQIHVLDPRAGTTRIAVATEPFAMVPPKPPSAP